MSRPRNPHRLTGTLIPHLDEESLAVRQETQGTRAAGDLAAGLAVAGADQAGRPAAAIKDMLAPLYGILGSRELTMTTADTRRLYPEAYGAAYVRDRDAYLTSGPAHVLILRARQAGTDSGAVKMRIRGHIGWDALQNYLHMPDNPGEALADIAEFAGYRELAQL
jgi:hypothetical protein